MIHLITGNTGAGKTSYAKQLRKETNGIIFSIDEWNKALFLPDKETKNDVNWFLERIERAEKVMLNLVEQLCISNVDAILDLGLAKFEHREKFRKFAKHHHFDFKLHFLNFSNEIRWKRIVKRNTEKGETFAFEVNRSDFDFMETWFEIPTAAELNNAVIINKQW